jgi:hypothetical protein
VDYGTKKPEILGTLAGVKILALTWPEKSSIGFVDNNNSNFALVSHPNL